MVGIVFPHRSGAEQSTTNDQYISDNPNIRDGVLYNYPYVESPTPPPPAPKVVIASTAQSSAQAKNNVFCSCVQALNAHYGTNFKTTNASHTAKSIAVTSQTPAATGFVVTYESRPGTSTGHIGHYYLSGDVIVIDWESNYATCQVTSGRTLPVGSTLIKGYIN